MEYFMDKMFINVIILLFIIDFASFEYQDSSMYDTLKEYINRQDEKEGKGRDDERDTENNKNTNNNNNNNNNTINDYHSNIS